MRYRCATGASDQVAGIGPAIPRWKRGVLPLALHKDVRARTERPRGRRLVSHGTSALTVCCQRIELCVPEGAGVTARGATVGAYNTCGPARGIEPGCRGSHRRIASI